MYKIVIEKHLKQKSRKIGGILLQVRSKKKSIKGNVGFMKGCGYKESTADRVESIAIVSHLNSLGSRNSLPLRQWGRVWGKIKEFFKTVAK